MKTRYLSLLLCALFLLTGCKNKNQENLGNPDNSESAVQGEVADLGDDSKTFGESLDSLGAYDGYFEESSADIKVECISGTQNAYTLNGTTLTFGKISEETVYSISGALSGNIVIDVGDAYKFDLELHGFSLVSSIANPITVKSGDEVAIKAKKDTKNYIYDMRNAIDESDETLFSGAIHSEIDLEIGGKGELVVISENNNGIHSKDDLQIKNLTLLVACTDNSLKGNDSVEIEGGNTTLISSGGDCIKTSNSNISEKGNQRGSITVSGGTHTLYSARDGIDAAYNVTVSDSSTVISIYTDKYSNYSKESAASTLDTGYMPGDLTKGPGGRPGGRPDGGMGGAPGGGMGGFPGGGMGGGNPNKGAYSTKGIKAANEIFINAGNVSIKSYDDSIHAGSDVALENGASALGNVTVNGGNITVYSCDDGLHADGKLSISDGTVSVSNSFEGIEGAVVSILGGYVSVNATDDGVNATSTSAAAITIGGGTLYIYCTGDGIDSNSRSSYNGIVFSGGKTVVISNSGGNSAIDSEQGYSYIGGSVVAVMPRGSMANEAISCQNFTNVGKYTQISLSKDSFLVVGIGETSATVKMPASFSSAYLIVLGDNSPSITTESSTQQALDKNGVAWN